MILSLINVQGVVLKDISLGETDKIITVFTDKLGKIDIVAHGARRPKSPIASSTLPFCYSRFLVYKGKNLYTLRQSSIIESFQRIIMDLNKLAYGSYFLELIDILNEKEVKNVYMLGVLLKTLYLLYHDDIDLDIIKLTFEYKVLSFAGFQPIVNSCIKCKRRNNLKYFSIKDGGIFCSDCVNFNNDFFELKNEEINFLNKIRNIKIEELRNIKYDRRLVENLSVIMEKYVSYHVERQIKSLNLIKDLKGVDGYGRNNS
ncbi:DNA replication and repair protein RecO [Caloramator fervidus]|uniref:DNA repair protein RecO n=1 Tax=Caloramator fervidus TaxID=29344 RepID=A0A1H5UIK8_9CLOT|nr:DNA replication and repair protein RecO [Caloramator fervidus]